MRTLISIIRGFLPAILLIPLSAVDSRPATTIDDIGKKLVGKWEGVVDVKQDRGRTLVIQSIKKDGDYWSAEARYGTTGGGLARVKVKVIANGDGMTLEYVSSANNPVLLRLINDKEMDGTLTVFVSSQAGSKRALKLTKVE